MTAPTSKKTFKTPEYRKWEGTLNDVAAAAVDARVKNLQHGKKGDWEPVGEGVCELRFKQTGPGWRVYFHETNAGALILLLLGGDKSSQKADIKQAKQILKELKAKQAAIKKGQKEAKGKMQASARKQANRKESKK